jgi:DNA polymerase III delta prime subunit
MGALTAHTNVLLYGPPGTGKTHLMHRVAERFIDDGGSGASTVLGVDTQSEHEPFVQLDSARAARWVTFHQGYSYEDFVVGLRPDTEGSDKLLALKPRAGLLLELAAEIMAGAEAALLLIDEVNRGNTSRIFGEFITLLEPDKRLDPDGNVTDTTVSVNLPYLSITDHVLVETSRGAYRQGREFRMPAKLYTLASMNSVDKSIAPIDTALRRRFHVVGLEPTEADVFGAVGLSAAATSQGGAPTSREEVASVAASALLRLNHGIGLFMGPEFSLGQWYLAEIGVATTFEDARAALVETWLHRLLPQLQELFHGRTEQLLAVLMSDELGPCPGLGIVKPGPADEDLGATPFTASRAATDEAVLAFVAKLARATEQS